MKLIKRKLYDSIVKWLNKPEIIVIIGSRQVGKTTLLKYIKENIHTEKTIYLDLEDLELLNLCNKGVESFLGYLRLNGYRDSEAFFVFIDEIQYLDNPSNFLKLLHDHHPDIKLIVSGSSTLDIRKKFKDSLTGRKIVFELNSFSFEEFLSLKYEHLYTIKKHIGNIKNIVDSGAFDSDLASVSHDFNRVLTEYLIWGGYPRNIHESGIDEKQQILKEIYNSYVRKDIKDIAQINDLNSFNNLIRILADQTGGLMNINELSNTVGINLITLKRYIFLLENTFIISTLNPYYRNKRKEISKMPKVFFNDTGLNNTVLNSLTNQSDMTGMGQTLENFIFNELRRHFKINENLFFWRTTVGSEVDFVIIDSFNNLIPIEIKTTLKAPQVTRSFRSFISSYNPKFGFIFNQSLIAKIDINGTKIYFIPHFAV